jgi:hypothetical protein
MHHLPDGPAALAVWRIELGVVKAGYGRAEIAR